MGKKSKKGTTRAGKTARPSAGKGKNQKGRKRSGSQSGSIVSKEDLSTLSLDDKPIVQQNANVNPTFPPENVSMPTPTKAEAPVAQPPTEVKEAVEAVVAAATNGSVVATNGGDENKPVEESVAVAAKETLEKEMPAVAAAVADKGEDVWSNNIRDVVTETTPAAADDDDEPAVLDVTIDEGDNDDAVAVREDDAVAVVKSRELPVTSEARGLPIKSEAAAGLVDLAQPAVEEAQAKQKDCGCIIL